MISTILGLGLWVCASISRADAPPNYVAVDRHTRLQIAIDGPSIPSGRLIPSGSVGAESHLLLQWIEESGDWVKLATTTEDISDLDAMAWLRPYQLNLYVRQEKLAPVLTKLHTHTDKDGLQVLLLPGRPLVQVAPDLFDFKSIEFSDFDPVSPEAVSDRFQISTLKDWIAVEEAWYCSMDNGLLPARQGCWVHEKGYSYSWAKRAYRLRSDGEGLIALTQNGDWRFDELRIAPESAHRDEPPQTLASENRSSIFGMMGGQTAPELQTVQLSEGIPIYWPDGSTAGLVRETHELYEAQLEVSDSQMRCAHLPWAMPEHLQTGLYVLTSEPQTGSGSLVICFGEKDLLPASR